MQQPRPFVCGSRAVGIGHPALVVAEIGQNHNGRLSEALSLIDAAAWAGADAVKVTKRDLSCELTQAAAQALYRSPHAYGKTYGEHRQALELSDMDHATIAERIRSHGLCYLGTGCDLPSVSLLRGLGVDSFKIASRDLGNLPLVKHVAALGQPVIASTGMSDEAEVDAAVAELQAGDCPFVMLHCTSLYPTPRSQTNLRRMTYLAERFDCLVGFSDHTLELGLCAVAAALGACVLEKHLTLDKQGRGSDHACSLEPEEFRRLVQAVRHTEEALGQSRPCVSDQVKQVRYKLGRSLVTRRAIPAGTRITAELVMLKSPGSGISWAERQDILGRLAVRDLPADTQLQWEDVSPAIAQPDTAPMDSSQLAITPSAKLW